MSTTATKEKTSRLIGAYLVNGTMGNLNMPGAPIMHFSLVVVPGANSVSGSVEITQGSVHGQPIIVRNVKGTIRATGFGKVTKVVALEGQYTQSVPPPAIGTYLAQFSAHMAIDDNWDGQGSFSYGGHDVEDVPVHKNK